MPAPATAPPPPQRRVRLWGAVVVAGCVAVGAGAAAWWLARGPDPSPPVAAAPAPEPSRAPSSRPLDADTLAVLECRDGHLATLARLEKMSRGLPVPDGERLRDWAAGPPPAVVKEAAQWASLVNEVFNLLRRQKQPVELVDTLAGLSADRKQPVVLRDYAVQHLGS